MPKKPDAKWASAHQLAEVAEALAIPTDLVMASRTDSSGITTVMFSRPEDIERIFTVLLRRDGASILRRHSVPVELPGGWEAIRRRIEEELQ